MGEFKSVLVDTTKELNCLRKLIAAHEGVVALDTETDGLMWQDYPGHKAARIVGYSVSIDEVTGYYIPVRHTKGTNLDPEKVADFIQEIINTKPVVFHNAKFDMKLIHLECVDVYNKDIHDSMLMSMVWDISKKGHGLKQLSKEILKYTMRTFADTVGDEGNFGALDPKSGYEYAADDAVCTYNLYQHFINLEGWDFSAGVYETERHALTAFVMMEMQPFYIATDKLRETDQKILEEVEDGQETIESIIPGLNVNSPKQLINYLFDPQEDGESRYEYDYSWGTTDKGNMKADKDVLKALHEYYPEDAFITALQTVKLGKKIHGTYLKNISDNLYPGGYIHIGFRQMGTETGRSSAAGGTGVHDELYKRDAKVKKSADGLGGVNVQNIPFRKIGDIFCAPTGSKIVSLDYKSQELGLLANISEEPTMLKNFKDGVDGHTATASVIFGVEPSKVEKWQRSIGKTINFAITFGSGTTTIAASINRGLPEGAEQYTADDAQEILDNFFDGAHVLSDWLEARKEEVEENGWMVYNVFGRVRPLEFMLRQKRWCERRYLPFKPSKGDKASAGRKAVSQQIQGSAADLMKMALRRVASYALENSEEVQLVAVIHDAVKLYVKDNENLHKHADAVAKLMELEDVFEDMGWSYVVPAEAEIQDDFMGL